MNNLKLMSYFLGFHIPQTDDNIFISQNKYVIYILKRFKEGIKELVNPTYFIKGIVGSFSYLGSSRLDIVYDVGIIISFMEKPY